MLHLGKRGKIGFIRPVTLFALFSYQLAPKPLDISSCRNKRYFTLFIWSQIMLRNYSTFEKNNTLLEGYYIHH